MGRAEKQLPRVPGESGEIIMEKEKRVFIAATRQNDGKTVISLGLTMSFLEHTSRIGFIKPVGQRYIVVEGKQVDEDSVLVSKVCNLKFNLTDMSPIAVERGFTEKFVEKGHAEDLEKRILDSYGKIAKGNELVIIEGTGHAGVGAIFKLHNARVAKLLQAKVVLISVGGIGKPFDEIMLNHALFSREGVEILGVIINKVLPEKMDKVNRILRKALQREGIKLLGVVPYMKILSSPTITQVFDALKGELLSGDNLNRRVDNIVVGAMAPHHALSYFAPGSLVITPGDREDIILAAMAKSHDIVALVLTCNQTPHHTVLELVRKAGFPVMKVATDTYTTASRIHDLVVKISPEDREKIDVIGSLVKQYVGVEEIYHAL